MLILGLILFGSVGGVCWCDLLFYDVCLFVFCLLVFILFVVVYLLLGVVLFD